MDRGKFINSCYYYMDPEQVKKDMENQAQTSFQTRDTPETSLALEAHLEDFICVVICACIEHCSTKEADKVKILQCCNGLLLCTGSRRHAINYVYNPSTNLFKILRKQDYANDDSILYGCAGLRYYVDTDDFMTPLPEGWLIWSTVWSTILRERKDDSFLMINLSGKVVEYNLISKNLRDMYDMGSNQVTDDYHDGFILPFAMYDMRPKQLDHKVYEFIPSYASV
ncbi:hypothetical protein Tco_0087575 [Tanacetum coccineum]